MEGSPARRFANRWLWLCPLLGILVAAGVLVAFGFSIWTALLAALLLVCPALIVWGAVKLRHQLPRRSPNAG